MSTDLDRTSLALVDQAVRAWRRLQAAKADVERSTLELHEALGELSASDMPRYYELTRDNGGYYV